MIRSYKASFIQNKYKKKIKDKEKKKTGFFSSEDVEWASSEVSAASSRTPTETAAQSIKRYITRCKLIVEIKVVKEFQI